MYTVKVTIEGTYSYTIMCDTHYAAMLTIAEMTRMGYDAHLALD